jgi:hypothetical protein
MIDPEVASLMSEEQVAFIEKVKTVAMRAVNNWAPEADRLGLPILSRELDYLGHELLQRLELQLKSLKGEIPPKGFE